MENGGTFVVPGSATDSRTGQNQVTPDTDAAQLLAQSSHGVVALTAPKGTC